METRVDGQVAPLTVKEFQLLQLLPGACWVEADPNVLWRVFDNVLDKAVRHTPPGGQILTPWFQGDGGRAVHRFAAVGLRVAATAR